MIELYSGTPGSGKSLHVAERIYFSLSRKSQNVIANFDINLDVIKHQKASFTFVDNWDLTPDFLIKYAMENHQKDKREKMLENQTLLVIDECQILFNSRTSIRDKDRMAWCTFFTQHRKYGFTVILVTQFDRMIDRQIRALIEYNYLHRKVSNFGVIGFFLGALFAGKLFVSIKYWYGIGEKVGSEWFVFHKKYGRMYDSYKLFSRENENKKRQRKILNGSYFITAEKTKTKKRQRKKTKRKVRS